MFRRSDLLLKTVCGLAGAVLLYQSAHLVLRGNPLAKVKIPQLPSLTNAPAGTNTSTNLLANSGTNKPGTNVDNRNSRSSNALALSTNLILASNSLSGMHTGAVGTPLANALTASNRSAGPLGNTASRATNALTVAAIAKGTNRPPTSGSNDSISARSGARPMGMPGAGPGGAPGPAPPLPKIIQARVDRIVDSELLAPVTRPLPLALLGIGGDHVFLRAPNGQTGLVKVGDTLGGIKLLKVGINRVLIEEDGKDKELTIFSGMGGESLMQAAKTNL